MNKDWMTNTIETSAVCIPNINTEERSKRLASGGIGLAITLAILGAMMAFSASRWWRLLLFPMFAGSASGYFQWRDHT